MTGAASGDAAMDSSHGQVFEAGLDRLVYVYCGL